MKLKYFKVVDKSLTGFSLPFIRLSETFQIDPITETVATICVQMRPIEIRFFL